MSEPVIELRGIQHRYDTDLVLRDVDLTIEQGETFGFLGHNGAGTTTARNMLTTLLTPTGGTAGISRYDDVASSATFHPTSACRGT
jgi:ABC-2 type transport system ATP-binding protein